MYKQYKQPIFLAFIIAVIAISTFLPSKAYANITLLPTRIIFEEGSRFAEVTLVNTSGKTKTYEMSWAFFRMQEKGSVYKPSKTSITDFDPSKYIFFTPKRVTLAPHAKQKVKLVLRRPNEAIPPGDYHSHLRFAEVQTPQAAGEDLKEKKTVVKINVGYTIPVILRSGKPDMKAEIESVSLKRNDNNGLLTLTVPIKRTGGPYAIMGHLFVYHMGADGKKERVGEISNAHLFPEIDKRYIEVPLIKDIHSGSLHIEFRNHDPKNNFLYAEKTVPLQ